MDKFVDGTGQTWFYCYEVGLWFNNLNFIGIGYRYFEIHPDVPEDTCHLCGSDVADCIHAVMSNRRREERILDRL